MRDPGVKSFTTGVTSPCLGQVLDISSDISSGSPSPCPLGLLPYPGLGVPEAWRASLCLGLDFLGVSGQEDTEG